MKKIYFLFLIGAVLIPSFALAQTSSNLDTEPPSDVENLKATAGNRSVKLRWSLARDNEGLAGYRIYRGTKPVKSEDDEYDLPTVSVKNKTSAVVSGLQNGRKYYFSVSAVDRAGNESENYSNEASAIPRAPRADERDKEGDPQNSSRAGSSYWASRYNRQPAETGDSGEEEFVREGAVQSTYINGGLVFYLHTADGKKYHLMNEKKWRDALKYTRGDFKGRPVRVAGKASINRFGKVFGINFSRIEELSSEEADDYFAALKKDGGAGGRISARGKIRQMSMNASGRRGLYLFSEEDGKRYLLQNRPDWEKAWDFMIAKTRAEASGKPVYNAFGRLIGIRYDSLEALEEDEEGGDEEAADRPYAPF